MNRPAQKPRGVKCAWILWTACSMGIGALINNSLNLFQSTALQPTPDAPAGAPPVEVNFDERFGDEPAARVALRRFRDARTPPRRVRRRTRAA